MRLCSNPSTNPAFKRILQLAEGQQLANPGNDEVTWDQAVRVRHQVQHRLTQPEVELLARCYLEGSTLNELAGHFRVHRHTVMELLEKAGISRRGKGPSTDEIATATELYEEGHATATIGLMLGFSGETIRQRLLEAGISIRGPHEWRQFH